SAREGARVRARAQPWSSPPATESMRRSEVRTTRTPKRVSASMRVAPRRRALEARRSVVLAALALEAVALRVGEEDVEGGQRAVAGRGVLLHGHLVLVRERRVRVDALLEDAELVAHQHDLVEEGLDRDALLGRALLAGLEHELAALPSPAEGGLADPELLADHLRQDFAEGFDVHVEIDLLRQRRSLGGHDHQVARDPTALFGNAL